MPSVTQPLISKSRAPQERGATIMTADHMTFCEDTCAFSRNLSRSPVKCCLEVFAHMPFPKVWISFRKVGISFPEVGITL